MTERNAWIWEIFSFDMELSMLVGKIGNYGGFRSIRLPLQEVPPKLVMPVEMTTTEMETEIGPESVMTAELHDDPPEPGAERVDTYYFGWGEGDREEGCGVYSIPAPFFVRGSVEPPVFPRTPLTYGEYVPRRLAQEMNELVRFCEWRPLLPLDGVDVKLASFTLAPKFTARGQLVTDDGCLMKRPAVLEGRVERRDGGVYLNGCAKIRRAATFDLEWYESRLREHLEGAIS